MLYVIAFALIGASFIVDDAKSRIDILIILFLSFIVAANSNNSDFFWYNQAYNMLGSGFADTPSLFETGWNLLNIIGNAFGLTYNGFISVVMFIGLMLMRSTAKFYLGNRSMVWGCYAIFPAVLYCVQVRSFASAAILIYALRFLSQRDPKRVLIYILLVILASEFHVTALAFLPFALVPFIPRGFKKSLVVFVVALLALLLSQVGSLSEHVLSFVGDDRGSYYENFFQDNGGDVPLRCVAILVSCFALVWFIGRRLEKIRTVLGNDVLTSDQSNFLWVMQLMTLASFLLIPLLLHAADFMRLQRVLMFPLYVLFSVYLSIEPKVPPKAVSFIALISIEVASYWFFISGNAENTTFALLDFSGMPPLFK